MDRGLDDNGPLDVRDEDIVDLGGDETEPKKILVVVSIIWIGFGSFSNDSQTQRSSCFPIPPCAILKNGRGRTLSL